MLVTLSGMLIEFKDVQPEKALPPMLVTLSGMIIEVKDVQSEKAAPPMLVTLSGMLIDFILVFLKASLPIVTN